MIFYNECLPDTLPPIRYLQLELHKIGEEVGVGSNARLHRVEGLLV